MGSGVISVSSGNSLSNSTGSTGSSGSSTSGSAIVLSAIGAGAGIGIGGGVTGAASEGAGGGASCSGAISGASIMVIDMVMIGVSGERSGGVTNSANIQNKPTAKAMPPSIERT